MKNKVSVVGIAVIVIAVFACVSYFFFMGKGPSQETISTMNEVISLVDDFQKSVIKIDYKNKTKEEIDGKLKELKEIAQDSLQGLDRLDGKIQDSGDVYALPVKESIMKSRKYIENFVTLVEKGNIIKADHISMGNVMCNQISSATLALRIVGSPDQGDVSQTLSTAYGMVEAAEKRNKIASIKNAVHIQPVSNSYWSNPDYRPYYDEIRSIIADYSDGRKILNRVITDYDRGMLSQRDVEDWSKELQRRRALIERLDSVRLQIPSDTIYKEHHTVLYNMISDAISVMEDFGNCQNSGTRGALGRLSKRNSEIMDRTLKPFYGIR